MEMKEIALKLCDLPEGEYVMESKLGEIKIQNIRPNERNDFRVVKIFINDELYDEITYSTFDYCHIWEKIHKKNNGQQYIVKREVLENNNEVQYTDKNGETFKIHNNCIYNYNNSTLAGPSYYIDKGILSKKVTSLDNVVFTYNLETDEKVLYVRKDKNEQTTMGNSITIKGDFYKFISKYNLLVSIINSNAIRETKHYDDLNEYTKELCELIELNSIPKINLKEVKKLDEELDTYINIYKEYAPILKETHSAEMLEILDMVSTILDITHNPKSEKENNKKTNNKQKMFNLSKYKNK